MLVLIEKELVNLKRANASKDMIYGWVSGIELAIEFVNSDTIELGERIDIDTLLIDTISSL